MTPEEFLLDETSQWLRRAKEDLEAATLLSQSAKARPALFHCQQAVEKSLKAFLTWHQRVFAKTHDLEELGRACCSVDGSLADILVRASPLTHFAWRFRYPSAPYEPDLVEAAESLKTATEVYEQILKRLPASAHP
jgi:HEPN domain-containing protein